MTWLYPSFSIITTMMCAVLWEEGDGGRATVVLGVTAAAFDRARGRVAGGSAFAPVVTVITEVAGDAEVDGKGAVVPGGSGGRVVVSGAVVAVVGGGPAPRRSLGRGDGGRARTPAPNPITVRPMVMMSSVRPV